MFKLKFIENITVNLQEGNRGIAWEPTFMMWKEKFKETYEFNLRKYSLVYLSFCMKAWPQIKGGVHTFVVGMYVRQKIYRYLVHLWLKFLQDEWTGN